MKVRTNYDDGSAVDPAILVTDHGASEQQAARILGGVLDPLESIGDRDLLGYVSLGAGPMLGEGGEHTVRAGHALLQEADGRTVVRDVAILQRNDGKAPIDYEHAAKLMRRVAHEQDVQGALRSTVDRAASWGLEEAYGAGNRQAAVRRPGLPADVLRCDFMRVYGIADVTAGMQAHAKAKLVAQGEDIAHLVGPSKGQRKLAVVAERVDGATLDVEFTQGGFAFADGLRVAASVARRLADLHEAGCFNPDVKPQNIMLERVKRPFTYYPRDAAAVLEAAGNPVDPRDGDVSRERVSAPVSMAFLPEADREALTDAASRALGRAYDPARDRVLMTRYLGSDHTAAVSMEVVASDIERVVLIDLGLVSEEEAWIDRFEAGYRMGTPDYTDFRAQDAIGEKHTAGASAHPVAHPKDYLVAASVWSVVQLVVSSEGHLLSNEPDHNPLKATPSAKIESLREDLAIRYGKFVASDVAGILRQATNPDPLKRMQLDQLADELDRVARVVSTSMRTGTETINRARN